MVVPVVAVVVLVKAVPVVRAVAVAVMPSVVVVETVVQAEQAEPVVMEEEDPLVYMRMAVAVLLKMMQ